MAGVIVPIGMEVTTVGEAIIPHALVDTMAGEGIIPVATPPEVVVEAVSAVDAPTVVAEPAALSLAVVLLAPEAPWVMTDAVLEATATDVRLQVADVAQAPSHQVAAAVPSLQAPVLPLRPVLLPRVVPLTSEPRHPAVVAAVAAASEAVAAVEVVAALAVAEVAAEVVAAVAAVVADHSSYRD